MEGTMKENVLNLMLEKLKEKYSGLSNLEKELARVEKLRRRKNYSKRFKKLRRRILKINAKLRQQNRTENYIRQSVLNTLDYYSFIDKNTPITVLGVAEREYVVLGLFIDKLKENIRQSRTELIKDCGLVFDGNDPILDELV